MTALGGRLASDVQPPEGAQHVGDERRETQLWQLRSRPEARAFQVTTTLEAAANDFGAAVDDHPVLGGRVDDLPDTQLLAGFDHETGLLENLSLDSRRKTLERLDPAAREDPVAFQRRLSPNTKQKTSLIVDHERRTSQAGK